MYMSIFCSCLLTLPISGRHWMGGGGGGMQLQPTFAQ